MDLPSSGRTDITDTFSVANLGCPFTDNRVSHANLGSTFGNTNICTLSNANTAQVSGISPDPNPANNTDTEETTVVSR